MKIPEKRFCRLSGDSDRDNGFWHLYLFETRANSDEHISSRAPRILAISFHLACVVVGLRALKIVLSFVSRLSVSGAVLAHPCTIIYSRVFVRLRP